MGCCVSTPAHPEGGKKEGSPDLAYLSAFPDGAPTRSFHGGNAAGKDEDLDLMEEEGREKRGSRDPAALPSSDDDELILVEEGSDDEAANSRRHVSFKHTHKLHIGVLQGTTFLNNYIVVDTLGRGTFGKVKLCLSIEDDSLYAVKVVDKRLIKQVAKSRQLTGRLGRMCAPTPMPGCGCGPTEVLEDLRREVEIMRALDHPNLVKLYEVIDDRESGKLLMVVEYAEAGALVRPGQLTPERRMPEAIAQFYFRQMASGLAYLHSHGVVHGDMKPENVLLAGDATVKIADFGQSRLMNEGQDTLSRTLGTPAFMSPEICAGDDYKGRAADVWALGVSLYSFIYGELPFKGQSLLELYDAIVDLDVPFPPAVPTSIELQDLLLRTLCKDPEARISAEELLRHPWVQEDDLMTLMPSLFPDEAVLAGGADVWEGEGGSSPPPRSPEFVHAALGGGSPRWTGPGVVDGSSSGPEGSSPPAGGSPNSQSSWRAQGISSPAPADVAAAVFPSLFSSRDASGGGKGGNSGSGGGAFTLGPASSIVGALQHAALPQNRLGAHPSGSLHLLARDSMVRRLSSMSDTNLGGTFDRQESGQSESDVSVQSGIEPLGPSESSASGLGGGEGGNSGGGARGAAEDAVERSGPSAFSLMVQQAQAAQARLIVQRHEEENPEQALFPPNHRRSKSGRLQTIEESVADVDLTFRSSSLITAPAESLQMTEPASSTYESADMNTAAAAAAGTSAAPPPSAAIPIRSVTPPATQLSLPSAASHSYSHSLSFAGEGSMPLIVSPFESFTAKGGNPFAAQLGSREGAAAAAAVAEVDGGQAAREKEAAAQKAAAASPSVLRPSTFAEEEASASKEGSSTREPPPAPPFLNGDAAAAVVVSTSSSAAAAAAKIPSADGRGKVGALLHRLSFRRNPSSDPSVDPTASAEHSLPPAPTSTAPPPSQPSAGLSEEPLIQWCVYNPGQQMAHYSGTSHANIIHYVESGTAELRWEATLPVPLASVFSTLQKPPSSKGSEGTAGLHQIDSVALAAHQVTTLPGGRPSTSSAGSALDRSETMVMTLQQATQRAETLMKNATGGSLDNLLLSQRGAAQFIGALSMLDPDFFVDRWRASAIAMNEVVAIRMTRAGLDQFLSQNPLAQVHLRASMARARAEITKLEALERIADAHRHGRAKVVAKGEGRARSWKLSDVGKVFGATMAEAAEAVSAGASGAAGTAAGAASGAAGAVAGASKGAGRAAHTAGLDVFALVSKLRDGVHESMWDAFLPLRD